MGGDCWGAFWSFLALSGHREHSARRPLSGVRTEIAKASVMSANEPKRTMTRMNGLYRNASVGGGTTAAAAILGTRDAASESMGEIDEAARVYCAAWRAGSGFAGAGVGPGL